MRSLLRHTAGVGAALTGAAANAAAAAGLPVAAAAAAALAVAAAAACAASCRCFQKRHTHARLAVDVLEHMQRRVQLQHTAQKLGAGGAAVARLDACEGAGARVGGREGGAAALAGVGANVARQAPGTLNTCACTRASPGGLHTHHAPKNWLANSRPA